MQVIGIEIPYVNGEQEVEVEIKINGEKKQYHYRVEIFYWDDCPDPLDRAACIKKFIDGYSSDWKVSAIGGPTDTYIPITFKRNRH